MIPCQDCELCQRGPGGEMIFICDPFTNIKEPECLAKWQLIKLDTMISFQQRIQEVYDRMAPMQERLFQYMEREIEDQDEADSWKQDLNDDLDDEDLQ